MRGQKKSSLPVVSNLIKPKEKKKQVPLRLALHNLTAYMLLHIVLSVPQGT
jgi:hypothetical protein